MVNTARCKTLCRKNKYEYMKIFCQENIILRPNEVKQLTLGIGFMMSDGVVLVSLANSLRKNVVVYKMS